MSTPEDLFSIFDLKVDVVGDPKTFVCSHTLGEAFRVEGENLIFPAERPRFSLYSLAALLPLIPAKQRDTHPNDWMTTDAEISCPDPFCGAKFRITRTGRRSFRHAEVTRVPLRQNEK